MPIARVTARWMRYLFGALLALYIAAPAYAFNPAQVPLLSSPAVPSNLMLLVDSSGSMYNIIWSAAFNPAIDRAPVSYYSTQCVNAAGVLVLCPFATTINGNETLSLGDINANGVPGLISLNCPVGGLPIFRNGNQYCMKLPDPAGNGLTRYTADYLSWLIDSVPNYFLIGYYGDFTGSIPNDFRMNVAKTVASNLVTNNPGLRIGLSSFNPPTNSDRGPGGRIAIAVTDLSPVPATVFQPNAVTQAQANTNIKNLKDGIAALQPITNTPLAETYYEITRYFRGMTSYYPQPATTYTSPIQYRCQKNYGVVITDGLPTYDHSFPNNDPDDVLDASRSLPNWDLKANDGNNPAGDGEGDALYLDDIAKFAYDVDMRKAANGTDLTKKSWDSAGFNVQNMSTYTVGFALLSNQMLIDAADDTHGHGKYYQSNDSAGLTSALNMALSDIYAKAGSGGSGAASSATLTSATKLYQTLYDPADWHGTIRAFNVDPITGAPQTLPFWTTDSQITSSAPGPTFESWSRAAKPLRVSLDYASFTPAEKKILDSNLPAGVNGTQLIAWSKGTANALLRPRTRLLGDVINSPLVSVLPTDKTSTDMAGVTSYATYLANKTANMDANLLVSSNDGFFNVIDPASGARRYAFMPSTSLDQLSTVASTNYGSGVHKFVVDGPIAVFDTQLGTSWRTVAFGGTGAGGKAYFAVKLFEGADTITALWEVRAPDTSTPGNPFNNLGYAYSKPEVARMADGTSIVVLGNGYGSFTGQASLFVLNANDGSLIREIPIPPQTGETDNGLSSVKLTVNAQNVVQAAYAGDLKGRLWKFDLSNASASAWAPAFGTRPLFTAPGGAAQPITVQPLLIDHPLNGRLVYFGTGKFSETTDKTANAQQAFYAIWDSTAGVGGIAQGDLQAQAILGTQVSNGTTYTTTSENDVDWTTRKGWYLPLSTVEPLVGERVIYPAQTARGRVLFTTAAVNSADPCESTGTGRVFVLDAAKGGMLNYQVLDTNGDGRIDSSDIRVAGLFIGTGIPNLAAIVAGVAGGNDKMYITDTSSGLQPPIDLKNSNVFQRIMWRQIQ